MSDPPADPPAAYRGRTKPALRLVADEVDRAHAQDRPPARAGVQGHLARARGVEPVPAAEAAGDLDAVAQAHQSRAVLADVQDGVDDVALARAADPHARG